MKGFKKPKVNIKVDSKYKYKVSSLAVTLGIIAIAVLLSVFTDLLVARFPIKVDMTQNKLYELSDASKDFLRELDKPVTITYLVTSARNNPMVEEVVSRYRSHSSQITFNVVDPINNPMFAQKYESVGSSLTEGSLLVTSGQEPNEKVKVIDAYSMYTLENSPNGIPMQTGLQVEGKLTGAISYVTRENSGAAYFVTGHGEMPADSLRSILDEENVQAKDVNLATTDVPDDADSLFIVSPARDFMAEEIDRLDAYLDRGKGLQIYFAPGFSESPRLTKYLSEEWGLVLNNDLVIETDPARIFNRSPQNLLAVMQENEAIQGLSDSGLMMAVAQSSSITIEQARSVETQPLLTTGDSALSKEINEQMTLEQQPEDIQGQHNLAVLASKLLENGDTAKVLLTASVYTFDDFFLQEGALANRDYTARTIAAISGDSGEASPVFAIMPKSLRVKNMTLSMQQQMIFSILFVIIIPLAILILGLVVWIKRRRL